MSQALALLSAALFGVADFSGGLASRTVSAWRVTAWSQIFGLPLLFLALLTISPSDFTPRDLVFGMLAGAVGLIGITLFYKALASGTMSIVSPIVGVVSASIPIMWGLASGETFGPIQWVGIVGAVAAIVLIGGEPTRARSSTTVVLQALAAAVAFAVFFIAMDQTTQASGLWPLLAARAVTIPAALITSAAVATAAAPRSALGRLVFVGAADMGANIAVLLALQTGSLGITTVLAGLYPAFTVLAAMTVLKEKPTIRQGIGISIAVLAGALLTL